MEGRVALLLAVLVQLRSGLLGELGSPGSARLNLGRGGSEEGRGGQFQRGVLMFALGLGAGQAMDGSCA